MRRFSRSLIFLLSFCFSLRVHAQNFLNGDFEINGGSCLINAANATITSNLNSSNAYGSGNEIDLMNNTCGYGTAFSGDYFLCLANSSGSAPDAITMQLDAPLVAGQSYTLYYHDRGYDVNGCCPPGVPIEVGVSTVAGAQGTVVYTSPVPTTNVWSLRIVSFIAPNNGQYISFQAQNNNTRWTHIDCLSLGFNACCAPYTLTLSPINATCGQSNGMAVAAVSGGGGPFTYSWNTNPVQTTDTAFNLAPGTYQVTVSDTNGCSGTDSVTIVNVNLLNLAVNPLNATICSGDSVLIIASGAATYSWNPSAGLSSVTDSAVMAFPSATTTYTVTAQLSSCIDSAFVTVTVQPLPSATFSIVPDSACLGDTVTVSYTGNGSAGATMSWDFGGGNAISGTGSGPYQVALPASGNYAMSLVVTDSGCTSLPYAVTLPVYDPPTPDFKIAPPEICAGNYCEVEYLGNAGTTATYNWNFASGTVVSGAGQGPYILQYPTAGQEVLTLNVTQHGCAASAADTLQVNVTPQALFTASDTAGCDLLPVQFTDLSLDADSLLWEFGDGSVDTSKNPIHTFGVGVYTVSLIAYTQAGCSDTLTLVNYIHVYAQPKALFTVNPVENVPVYLDDATFQFTNASVNAASYWWSFGDTTFSDLTDPQHQYELPGNYTVILVATNGICTDTASLSFLMVDYNPTVFVPNVFTPNGDGLNDEFKILGFHIESMEMKIFNRWGQLIFSSSDPEQGWNGMVKGDAAEMGTYVYLIDVTFTTGERKMLKGNVTLLR